jgi:multidrug efflux pump subunit AcrA (membrane-fusion protein)
MWIVRLALRRTYTFVVAALLIAVLGAVSIYRMSTDIFPEIDIPVVSVVWQYFGMPADEIETRIIFINEKVTLTADALDPNTRTLTEVQVPNPDNALRPGMYLQVKFVFDRQSLPILIPAAALVTRTEGPMVGVLDSEQAVQYRKVQLGRDFGAEIQVLAGLSAGETVIVHPGDDLPEGTAVEPVPVSR